MYGLAGATSGTTFGVRGDVLSTTGRGVWGNASATTGQTYGVLGFVASNQGVGVLGQATAATGTTTGIRAVTQSPTSTAAIFDNLGGGKLISARTTGYVEKFSVDASGNLTTSGTVSADSSSFNSAIQTAVFAQSANYSAIYGSGTAGVIGQKANTDFNEGILGTTVNGRVTGVNGAAGGTFGRGIVGQNVSTGAYGEIGTEVGSGPTGVYGNGGSYGVYGDGGVGVEGSGATWGVYGGGTTGGVFGTGDIGVQGYGSTFSYGVFGHTASGYGVYGEGDNGVRGQCIGATSCTGVAGIGGSTGDGVYGQGGGYGVYSAGNTGASGSKSAVVALPDNRVVELYAMESPNVWFEDFGSAELSNGLAEVTLDPTFALAVNTDLDYHVFLTPKGDCEGLYVAQKTPHGFQIRELRGGKSNISFDYRIVARRRGYENILLQEVDADAEAIAAIREHGHPRPGRPRFNVPKKHGISNAASGPTSAEAGSPVFRGLVQLQPLGQAKAATPPSMLAASAWSSNRGGVPK